MADISVEIFLSGRTIKRKLIVSHLLSSFIPFLVVLYLLLTYVVPRMPAGTVYTQVLIAIFGLIGVLVLVGYGVAWDIGQAFSEMAKNAESREGFEALEDRGDEIGAVMRSFSQMLDVLKARTEEVNFISAKLEEANHEMAKMNQKLREMSYKDDLTGIYNRRYFNLALEEEIRRAERYRHTFSLVILDIDHFKLINDEHGHASGDKVLADIGRILKEDSRSSDVVCRFGGEEFAVILPETDVDNGRFFAEKMLQSVRRHDFVLDSELTVKVTTSAGVSMYPSGGDNFEDLVNTADKALYRAKSEGRDRVCVQQTRAG